MTLVFRWTALSRAGLVRRGSLGAPSQSACARELEAERLRPLRIALDVPGTLRALVQRAPRRRALADAFEYMGDLLALGGSQAKVLEHGATTTRDRALGRALLTVAQRVRRGEALSQSMAATGTFSPTVLSAVGAAEQTGTLAPAFAEIAARTRQEADLIAQIRTATAYPAFVAAVGVVIGGFITFVVLPRISQALSGLTTLPPVTRVMIAGGAHAGAIALGAGLATAGGLAAATVWYRAHPVGFWHAAWRLPLLGPALKDGLLARFFGTLAVFLRNGFPLLEALDGARQGLRNPALHQAVDRVRAEVRTGVALAQALGDPMFPAIARLAAERGEETGHVEKYLEDLSRLLHRQMVARVARLTTAIERLLLGLAAGFILFMALAFLLPIYGSLQDLSPYR
ncbi:MAG: type II secretion system F family protein [candidate division NC10 bacterium]